MKKVSKLLLVALFLGTTLLAWGQAAPSTEGNDFWVTFLRANGDSPEELKLTISAPEACTVRIENTETGYSTDVDVEANSSTELVMNREDCYSSNSETITNTALHVKSSKNISLFAGNYREKSFDATIVLPTSTLLNDYIVQTFPPSNHGGDNDSEGSHFAIVAVEDGITTVNYSLTVDAKANGSTARTGSVQLKQGEVCYVWTGKGAKDAYDLSGSTVKSDKKIAVFQGCPHTNIPYMVEDRDHIFSQAIPTAYWGTEFGITASRRHRRDIVTVMAINDGTKVYINDANGNPQLVHTFDFNVDKKHYWTFEIGEEVAYSTSKKSTEFPEGTQLPAPLVVDSSCYITTSCPAGVHLFMVSNRYDNETPTSTNISDPAMLWISPIEQVIKDINFATYNTYHQDDEGKWVGTVEHYVNIVTTTSNVSKMQLDGKSISKHFSKFNGNKDYSFARIQIENGTHQLTGYLGFLAHVYGYGERESYAYSCGSSMVEQSISLNDEPLMIDSVSPVEFCVDEEIVMKLNIGSNEYESVHWDFGDGTSYDSDPLDSNKDKKTASHTYTTPGWYDLVVYAKYTNPCTGVSNEQTLVTHFRVIEPEFKFGKVEHQCLDTGTAVIPANELDTLWPKDGKCEPIIYVNYIHYGKETVWYDTIPNAKDSYYEPLNGKTYPLDPTKPEDYIVDIELNVSELTGKKNQYQCDSLIMRHVEISTCLHMTMDNTSDQHSCYGEKMDVPYTHVRGKIGDATMQFIGELAPSTPQPIVLEDGIATLPTQGLKPGEYKANVEVKDGGCDETLTFTIPFTVYYPSDIFVYMFDNTLAVYKAGNGGNKKLQQDFTGYTYQWYLKGEPIPGANSSVYVKQDGKFAEGDSVFVEFIDPAGYKLKSCAQILPERDFTAPEEEDDTNNAPALKLLINNRLVIRKDGQTYNMYGQRVE